MSAVRFIVDGQNIFTKQIPMQTQKLKMKQFTDFVW